MDTKSLWEKKWINHIPQKNSVFSRKILKYIDPKQSPELLDVGCGLGEDALFFVQSGFDVLATDYSENALAKLPIQPKLHTRFLDVTDIPHDLGEFDVIYAHLSLHYFSDRETEKIFEILQKHLRKGGFLAVKCKSTDDLLAQKGTPMGNGLTDVDGKQYHFFSREYIKSLVPRMEILHLRKTSSVYRNYRSSFIELIAKK